MKNEEKNLKTAGEQSPDNQNKPLRKQERFGDRTRYIFLFVVTAIYLLFELAFSARLLDVVGSTIDEKRIDQVEFFGRLISGFALTLFVWAVLTLPNAQFNGKSLLGSIPSLALTAMICWGAMYLFQEAIVQSIVHFSTAEQKRNAASLVVVTSSVHSSDAELYGLRSEHVDLRSPEGKAFLALLPPLALFSDDSASNTDQEITRLLTIKVKREVGSPESVFNDGYLPSDTGIRKMFNTYLKIAEPHYQASLGIRNEQQKAYRKYRNSLGRYRPDNLPKRFHYELRKRLRTEGITGLPYDWHPTDKVSFYEAVAQKVRRKIDPRYQSSMFISLGFVVPSNLGFLDFQKHSEVQRKWRSALGIPYPLRLRTGMTYSEFFKQVYTPWIEKLIQDEAEKILAPSRTFESGGINEKTGVSAIKVTWVPFLALCFSMLGAIAHVFKTALTGLKIITTNRTIIWLGGMGFLFLLVALVVYPAATKHNAVTQSELYISLEKRAASSTKGRVLVKPIRMIVQIQPFVYPISEAIRTDVLRGIDFSWSLKL